MKMLVIGQPMPETDEEAVKYIPDNQIAHNFYYLHRKMGKSVVDAMLSVLETVVRVHFPELFQDKSEPVEEAP